MKHHTPELFRDDYGIGQRAMARIHGDIAAKNMLDCARSILSNGYVIEEVLASSVRMFHTNQPTYRKARSVMANEAIQ